MNISPDRMKAARLITIAPCVHVAGARIADLRDAARLPADEEAASRLPAWRHPEHLASRALLRWLLSTVADNNAAMTPLASEERGRPYLMGRPDLAVSMSHTDGWVAAAVHAGGLIGVDAQAPHPASEALIRRCCTPVARTELSRLPRPARDLELAWIWSVQEACAKVTGLGMYGLPWTIPVPPGRPSGSWRQVRWVALRSAFPIPVSCGYGPCGEPRA
jgi:4'-phosphopantetheinyl transferase